MNAGDYPCDCPAGRHISACFNRRGRDGGAGAFGGDLPRLLTLMGEALRNVESVPQLSEFINGPFRVEHGVAFSGLLAAAGALADYVRGAMDVLAGQEAGEGEGADYARGRESGITADDLRPIFWDFDAAVKLFSPPRRGG